MGPVDLTRLIHYTIVTDKGFTIHKTGLPALQMFLNTRMYLYSNVYYHRTTRAIDIHLRDIFGDTMKLLFNNDQSVKVRYSSMCLAGLDGNNSFIVSPKMSRR